MAQSRKASAAEAAANTLAGFLTALALQLLAFPLFSIQVELWQNFLLASIFMLASIARNYLVRRFFDWAGGGKCRMHSRADVGKMIRQLGTGDLFVNCSMSARECQEPFHEGIAKFTEREKARGELR